MQKLFQRKNTTTPDGSKVDSTGAKINISENTNGDNFNAGNSVSRNGWISENGRWYYYESGIIKKNSWLNLNGKSYYFGSDGILIPVNSTLTSDEKSILHWSMYAMLFINLDQSMV